jgi:hypothetical protein
MICPCQGAQSVVYFARHDTSTSCFLLHTFDRFRRSHLHLGRLQRAFFDGIGLKRPASRICIFFHMR